MRGWHGSRSGRPCLLPGQVPAVEETRDQWAVPSHRPGSRRHRPPPSAAKRHRKRSRTESARSGHRPCSAVAVAGRPPGRVPWGWRAQSPHAKNNVETQGSWSPKREAGSRALLFDENVSPRLVGGESDVYPGSVHVRDVGLARATDAVVWDDAREVRGSLLPPPPNHPCHRPPNPLHDLLVLLRDPSH